MKTIFITMSRGGTARNILQTGTYKKLKESGNRIVILTPAFKDEDFLNEFKADNVYFENLIEPKWTRLDFLLVKLHQGLVYNSTTKMRDLYGIYSTKEGGKLKYVIRRIIFQPLSKIKAMREFSRWLDKILVKDEFYKEVFDKYNPDLVFSTSIMEDADVFVLKQAQEYGIPIIGMTKTWDNIPKSTFRVKSDKLIVWSEHSKKEAIKFQNYKEDDVAVCGIPQFDFYKDEKYLMPREEFCREIGIDPQKKIIVFSSEGKIAKHDGEVAEIIAKFINTSELGARAVLFVRPYFTQDNDVEKFSFIKNIENVYIDSGYRRSKNFRDRWDYSNWQIKRFTNIMRHADVVITTASTVSLDAIAFDKPVINIAFDGYKKLSYAESIAHWYSTEYYKYVAKSGAVQIVNNQEELKNAIISLLGNPNLMAEQRKKSRDEFCYKIDGQSGARVAESVLGNL